MGEDSVSRPQYHDENDPKVLQAKMEMMDKTMLLMKEIAKAGGYDETDIETVAVATITEIRKIAKGHDVKWGDILKGVSQLMDEKNKERKASVDPKPILG